MDGRLKIDQGMESKATLKGGEVSEAILLPDNFRPFRRDKGKEGKKFLGIFTDKAINFYITEIQNGYGTEMIEDIDSADQ